jgi:hypothetical protein
MQCYRPRFVPVILVVAGAFGCGFDPHGVSAIDASVVDDAEIDAFRDGDPGDGPLTIDGNDACVPRIGGELCNGIDDTCDGTIDEGFAGLGATCDGADADLCPEGLGVCSGDHLSVVCNDATTDSIEICNGANDDCDATIDEGLGLGTNCDGVDGDLCLEGVLECDPSTGGTRCNDTTSTIVEQCNHADDDCDTVADDGFDVTSDVDNCSDCGIVCSNPYGTTACAASTCVPTCSPGANDCDSNPQTGCELRDTNPTCPANSTLLGFVNGDSGGTVSASGFAEAIYTVQVREEVTGNRDLRAQVTLSSPANTNFDLDVTCAACGGSTLSSNNLTGDDTIGVRRADVSNQNDSFTITVHVRWTSSSACGNWTLSVLGNTGGNQLQCN